MSQILHQKVALKEIRCPIKTKMQEKCGFLEKKRGERLPVS